MEKYDPTIEDSYRKVIRIYSDYEVANRDCISLCLMLVFNNHFNLESFSFKWRLMVSSACWKSWTQQEPLVQWRF